MSMTTCRECGLSVSTEAATCPNCGAARPAAGQAAYPALADEVANFVADGFQVQSRTDDAVVVTKAVGPNARPATVRLTVDPATGWVERDILQE
jgi:predicted amidophosphoribosyltransferase